MSRTQVGVIAGMLLALVLPVSAQAQPKLDIAASDFSAQSSQIRNELASGDQFSEITASDRATVLRLLDSMESQIGRVEAVSDLSPRTRTELFNQQEQVNVLLGQAAADSQQICRRVRPTGTRRSHTICTTAAEARREREDAGDAMRRMHRAEERVDIPG